MKIIDELQILSEIATFDAQMWKEIIKKRSQLNSRDQTFCGWQLAEFPQRSESLQSQINSFG